MKKLKFYLEIIKFKVFVRSNNLNNRFDLPVKYFWCEYCALFLLLLISEFVQKANELILKQQSPVQSSIEY